jgi:prepilin-type processing-associated H-X9-DG protein
MVLTLDEKDQAISRLLTILQVPLERGWDAATRSQSVNNLKQIGLGMLNHESSSRHLPSPASHDPDGKPLLSWRVAILPYLEEWKLYKQFHLDEPWDSPHNKALIEKMPAVFRSPKSKAAKGRTNYLVPVGDGAIFSSMKDQPEYKEIKDGSSNTIMTIEVDDQHAVVWTKPEDLPFDPANPKKGIGSLFEGGFNVGMCDGSVRFVPKMIDPKTLKALITRAGGEVVGGF